MVSSKDFFDKIMNTIDEVSELERENIYATAKMMGDCMDDNGVVQLFGLGFGLEFSMELGYRAGGLMPFHKVQTTDLVFKGALTEVEYNTLNLNDDPEMAHKLLGLYRIEKEDMFILISETGCEAIIVEAAKMAKAEGKKTIAVISKKASALTKSTHPSKEKLEDIVDLVIDTHAEPTDAILDVDGTHKMNHAGTIVGNVIAQMITAETYRYLVEKGSECPVLLSANLKGADVHNRRLSDKYAGRWNS